MAYADAHSRGGRLPAAAAAAVIEIGAVAALVAGFAASSLQKEADTLTAVTVSPQPTPSPSPSPTPSPSPSPRPEGRKGAALPREAPKAAVPMPVPAAAPTAGAGAAMTGAGSTGNGTGTGSAGDGSGGGGGGVPARRIGGALTDRDYPAAAAREGAAGTVAIRYRIGTDGRVHDCAVARSSGYAALDSLTCRLVEQRFRYSPARDANGTPREDSAGTSFTWGTRGR